MKKVSLIFILLIGFGCISYAQTITIGTQVWMTKNLDVATFRNGDPIPQAKTDEEWEKGKGQWLPEPADGKYVESLMVPCYEAGQYASWIAEPKVGVDNKPGDFEFVKLHMA